MKTWLMNIFTPYYCIARTDIGFYNPIFRKPTKDKPQCVTTWWSK